MGKAMHVNMANQYEMEIILLFVSFSCHLYLSSCNLEVLWLIYVFSSPWPPFAVCSILTNVLKMGKYINETTYKHTSCGNGYIRYGNIIG